MKRFSLVLTLIFPVATIIACSHIQQSFAQFVSGDAFSSRIRISGASGYGDGSNVGASKEIGEPNHAGNSGGASVWWTWTAPATGDATFNTQGSDFDTLLAIYTGNGLNLLKTVGSNDDIDGAFQSEVRFMAQQGQTYHIAVDGYGGATGTIALNWKIFQGSSMPADALGSSVLIRRAAGQSNASNLGASKESGEPNHAGNSGGASVWWTWTAPATDEVTFDTQGSGFDTLLAIYTGDNLSLLKAVSSNDDTGGTLQSAVRFMAQQGQTYHIAVDGYGGATGSIVLNWQTSGVQLPSAVNGVSTTVDNQILVELLPGDTTEPNPFDLNGLTLVFTPDGQGGYSRDVRSLAWEEDIGSAVADGAVIELESFGFVFAGQRWRSFHVSQRGLVTFGGPFAYKYSDSENRFDTMRDIATKFVSTPTISPLYKPMHGATQHVARWPDRVVVTWITSDPHYYVHGVPPENPDRFQVVLGANGSIHFNYADVALGDGIVGLFPNDEITKGALIASAVDDMNPDLPGHLDLLEVAVYESNTGVLDTGYVIVELTMREPLPDPSDSPLWSYHLSFDTDQPFWTHPDAADRDFLWEILVNADGDYVAHGPGVQGVLARDATNRIALHGYFGEMRSLSATLIAISTVQGEWVIRDWAPALRGCL